MANVETTTFNYHWIKPAIGGSSTVWGNRLNDDLDGIDNQVASNAAAVAALSTVVEDVNYITLNCPAAPATNLITGGVGAGSTAVPLWGLYLGDGEAQSGGNAGANFLIQGFSDTGSPLANPFEITRATGYVNIGNGLGVAGAASFSSTLGAAGAASFSSTLTATGAVTFNSSLGVVGALSAGSITFPNFAGGHSFQLGWSGAGVRIKVDSADEGIILATGYTAAGNAAIGGTFTASGLVSTGALSISGAVGFGSTLYVNNGATFNSTVSASGVIGTSQYFNVSGTVTALFAQALQLDTNCTITGNAGGMALAAPVNTGIVFNCGGAEVSEMDYGGNFFVAGQAYKPVAGGWLSSSDARVKTIERPYTLGLDEVMKLKPIVYRYKANDAEPGKMSRVERFKDRSYAGLIAQDVEGIFPNMVDKRKGWIDGEEVDDLRTLDTYELMFALVNAVKTLTARVAELEAR